jgi:hypothetical protein
VLTVAKLLSDDCFQPRDALRCIDEIVARYTGRGNSMDRMLLDDPERKRLENCYPVYFNWEDF